MVCVCVCACPQENAVDCVSFAFEMRMGAHFSFDANKDRRVVPSSTPSSTPNLKESIIPSAYFSSPIVHFPLRSTFVFGMAGIFDVAIAPCGLCACFIGPRGGKGNPMCIPIKG